MKTLLAFRNKLLAGLALALACGAAQADIDLYANDITISNNPVEFNTSNIVEVEICNAGTSTVESTVANPVTVRLFSLEANLTTDGNPDDTKAFPVGTTIAQNACATISFDWTPSVEEGTVTSVYGLFNPGDFPLVDTSGTEYFDSDGSNDLISIPVTFEPLPPTAPELSCLGFYAPFTQDLSIKKKAKGTIPVKIELTDGDGYSMTDADLAAPPVINVTFNGTVYGDGVSDDAALESVGSSNDGNAFAFNPDSWLWEYRLSTKQFSESGTYAVSVASGDTNEYTINTGDQCAQSFIRQY